MTTKKSTNTGITYLGSPSSIPSTLQAQVINYEPSGVKYQKFFKIDKGSGNFELREQVKFMKYGQLTSANTSDDFVVAKNFKLNVTGLHINYALASTHPTGYVYLANLSTGSEAQVKWSNNLIKISDTYFIDFSSCPFVLENDYTGISRDQTSTGFRIGSWGLAASEYINYTLIGFLEEY